MSFLIFSGTGTPACAAERLVLGAVFGSAGVGLRDFRESADVVGSVFLALDFLAGVVGSVFLTLDFLVEVDFAGGVGASLLALDFLCLCLSCGAGAGGGGGGGEGAGGGARARRRRGGVCARLVWRASSAALLNSSPQSQRCSTPSDPAERITT